MFKLKAFLALGAIMFLSACASQKHYFLPSGSANVNENNAFQINNPTDKIILLYTPGSRHNHQANLCRENARAPGAILRLQGKRVRGKTIVFHGYCSFEVGTIRGEIKSMAEVRAPELEALVKQYLAQGVPADQIFISGHSMGAWAAVLVEAKKNVDIAGVIAFAPSNGTSRAGNRRPYHSLLIERQKTDLAEVKRLDALVFMFNGDPYNSPEDLAHMKDIPGVEYVVQDNCGRYSPHATIFNECFTENNQQQILDFITRKVKG